MIENKEKDKEEDDEEAMKQHKGFTKIHRALAYYFSGKWATGKPHEVMERGKSTNNIVVANRYKMNKGICVELTIATGLLILNPCTDQIITPT